MEALPDLIPFAEYLAERFECAHLTIVGALAMEASAPPSRWERRTLTPGEDLGCGADELGRTVLVCSVGLPEDDSGPLRASLRRWLRHAPAALVTSPCGLGTADATHVSELERWLGGGNLQPTFTGWTVADGRREQRVPIAVLERPSASPSSNPPAAEAFRAVAIVCAYNEADIIVPSVERMNREGVDVYLIDNWSTDGTYELARALLGRGLAGLERFPREGPTCHASWRDLLERKDELARELDADWVLHHDVDEIRVSPWPGVRLREAFHRVERAGFNCADFTVLNYPPVDDLFVPGSDFERHFRLFEFSRRPGHFLQIKAWKNQRERVALADSGGHEVSFRGRRVYPYKFLLKHYPIRSQAHGERKVDRERNDRWSPEEIAGGWHNQYASVAEGHSFLRAERELERYDAALFNRKYLVERLSGVGLRPGSDGRPTENVVEPMPILPGIT